MTALAIIDDIGAILVIAIFYTEQLHTGALMAAGGFLAVLVVFNLAGIRNAPLHFLVSVLLWIAMLKSGVHATVAGVLAAWTVPYRPKLQPQRFSEHVRSLMDRFDSLDKGLGNIIHNERQRAVVQAVESGIHRVESPLQRLEHAMHTPVAFLIVPAFALANAGVPIEFGTLGSVLMEPVTLGIILGLSLGKLVGVAGLTLVANRLGLGELPAGCSAIHIIGVGLLAGIGFTMSIFIAELGFRDHAELLVNAKTGILVISLAMGVAGFLLLRAAGRGETNGEEHSPQRVEG